MNEAVLFLVNPAAGSGAGASTKIRLEALLSEGSCKAQARYDLVFTDPHNLTDQAQAACARYGTLVAVGGDGTASQVARGIVQAGGSAHFGLIPLGTGNDLARSLGIYDPRLPRSLRSLQRALSVVLAGRPRRMDLLNVSGVGCCCNYFGVGLDGQVLADYVRSAASPWYTAIRRSTSLKFALYGLHLLRRLSYRMPPELTMRVRGEKNSAPAVASERLRAVIVGNTQTYAGGFVLNPAARMDDGRFEVTRVRRLSDIARILLARAVPLRSLAAGLASTQTDHVDWQAPPGVPWEWDGEPAAGVLPRAGCVTLGGPLSVLLPSGDGDGPRPRGSST